MKRTIIFCLSIFCLSILFPANIFAQTFTRSELPTSLTTPWEIVYGPDDALWLTDREGIVCRVDPESGEKTVVYTAPDYFGGSPLEDSEFCPGLAIGFGTLGLALHPDFTEEESAFIYFVYSYNSGTEEAPATKFRIKRLTWDAASNEVVSDSNIVNQITLGFDHLGGRLIAIEQGGNPYLILTIGDNGRSELSGDCYSPPSSNPNNLAQDVDYQNGKIHRFNMDGSIPDDNPIVDNSFYTRGHRNPQGLMYNPQSETLYCIEHGDDTDDEINVLHKGMNYGWKNIRGYHDANLEGETDYVDSYVPNSLIENDALVEPLYVWCTTPATSTNGSNWCTVAPSDGIYYGSASIPEWENSLLVVTLKNGSTTDREVFQFKLKDNGALETSTADNPNPKRYFSEDQDLNGRLRDIAVSPDGQKLYLINNGGAATSKITVYSYDGVSNVNAIAEPLKVLLYPNPATDKITLEGIEQHAHLAKLQISSSLGQSQIVRLDEDYSIDLAGYPSGVYFLYIEIKGEVQSLRFVKK